MQTLRTYLSVPLPAIDWSQNSDQRELALVKYWDVPSLDQYQRLCDESRDNLELMLIILTAPDAIVNRDTILENDAEASILLERLARESTPREFTLTHPDARAYLGEAANCDDYSFFLPPPGPIPMLVRHVSSDLGHPPQYVINEKLISLELGRIVNVPIICHSRSSTDFFLKQWSFTHELIHVLQRLFRKKSSDYISYRDATTSEMRHRNPQAAIREGIEDELEVQKILVRMGQPFNVEPVIHHVRSVVGQFSGSSNQALSEWTSLALNEMQLGDYSRLADTDIRGSLISAFSEAGIDTRSLLGSSQSPFPAPEG